MFALVLLIDGKDPVARLSRHARLCLRQRLRLFRAVREDVAAAADLARGRCAGALGLINVGGEGQLYMGGWLATAGALGFADLPAWLCCR